MNHAVVYLTKTGHSKDRLGDRFRRRALGLDIKTRPAIGEVDLLLSLAAFWQTKRPMMLEFVKGLSPKQIKKRSGDVSANGSLKQAAVRTALESRGIRVAPEEYCCKGSFLFFFLGHPNSEEIEGAVSFSKSFLTRD